MQTLKFKIENNFEDKILEYQRQYSNVLHVCFQYIKNDDKLGSLFDYKSASSNLMNKIKSLKHIELLKNWLIQSAISEAYSLVKSYSSFTGNIIFRNLNLPDMVLSSIEISRRGYQFRHQYILKDKKVQKNIVSIDINNDIVFKELFIKSMEEFSISVSFKNIIDVYNYFKANFKNCYRVSLENFSSSFRHFLTKPSKVNRYNLSILQKC